MLRIALLLFCLVNILLAQIIQIYPENNAVLSPEELTAVFTVDRSIMALVKSDSIRLYFNDRDVTASMRIIENTILFKPDHAFLENPELNGMSSIKLRIVRSTNTGQKRGTIDSSVISIYIKRDSNKRSDSGTVSAKQQFVNTGTIYTSHSYRNFSDSVTYTGDLSASGSGYQNRFFYNYNLYLNSKENRQEQTLQRFRISTGYGKVVKLTIGDITPVMNEYIVNGSRVRGVELDLSTPRKGANIDLLYGISKRAVDPFVRDSQALHTLDSTVKAIRPDSSLSHNDSIQFLGGGSYLRRVIGSRIHFGNGERVTYGLTVMQIRDIANSITRDSLLYYAGSDSSVVLAGISPQDNIVTGQDLAISFLQKRITLFSSAAFSILTKDIQKGAETSRQLEQALHIDSGTIPFELSKLEPLITINRSTTPLPFVNGVVNATAINGGVAVNFPIRSAREKGEVMVYRIGPNYRSLLNESCQTDRKGFLAKEELRLFDNRVITSVKYEYYQDNLNEALALKSTQNRKIAGSLNLNLSENIPQFTASVSSFTSRNESPKESDMYRDNRSLYLLFSGNYMKMIGEMKNMFTIEYSNGTIETNYGGNDTGNSVTNGIGVHGVTSFPWLRVQSRLGYNYSKSSGNLNSRMSNSIAGITYSLIPEKINLTGEMRYLRSSSVDTYQNRESMVRRLEGNLTGEYRLSKKQTVSLSSSALRSRFDDKSAAVYDYQFRLFYEFRY